MEEKEAGSREAASYEALGPNGLCESACVFMCVGVVA